LYTIDLPEAELPADVLVALLGIKEFQEPYDVSEEPEEFEGG
jgi:hypothetical protein